MITFFTIPKPFDKQYHLLQRNAIRSWLAVVPGAEVFVFGDEPGLKEATSDLGVTPVCGIRKSTLNTPFLDEVFRIAHDRARYDTLCFINSDIILLPDFLKARQAVKCKRFLMIGCRYDIDVSEEVTMDARWEAHFRERAVRTMKDDGLYGSDYFLYTRRTGLREIPNFIVGRPGWDNWMIYRARALKVPVIDASGSIHCVHQNHDYSHVPKQKGSRWDGPEGAHNLTLFTKSQRFSLLDATQRLDAGRLRWNLSPRHRKRLLSTLQVTHPEFLPVFRFFWTLARWRNRLLGRKV
jgi:hypothetical protein